MKVQVSEIPDEGLDIAFEESLEAESLELQSPVKVQLRVQKVGAEVITQGMIETRAALQCSRCLSGFSRDLAVPVDLVYHPFDELKGEEKHEVKNDELDTGFYQNDELDIQDLVMEQILLSVPMKPLCSETCKGICPKCGADLNLKACGCEQKEPDHRLAILKDLLKEGKE